MKYIVLFALLSIVFSVLYYYVSQRSVQQLCDQDTCPICFGSDLCNDINENKIKLEYSSVADFIFNIFSVKNVFFGHFNEKKVVLKKLAHNSELKKLDILTVNGNHKEIINILISASALKQFKICDGDSARLFLDKLNHKDIYNIETMIHVNIEPILLELFSSHAGWCVPKFYGSCGRLIVVENAGLSLSYAEKFSWFDRAYLTFQILQAAQNFTEDHEIFRLYLTDISPDNIAVDQNLKISFVDLENAILKKKTLNGTIHYTEHSIEEIYSFSEREICDSSISDHNIYAVCWLLLSKQAPWPMMQNGLLHTPPKIIVENYRDLLENIELCVDSTAKTSRFRLSKKILEELKVILRKFTKYLN